jgi:hypothetical protein
VRIIILPSEHCHSHLLDTAEVARVAALLARYVDRVEMLVYLRRQDRVAISVRSTVLKGGQIAPPVLPPINENDRYYNYAALLERWSAVSGEE